MCVKLKCLMKIYSPSLELKIDLTAANVAAILNIKMGDYCQHLKLLSVHTYCESNKFLPLFVRKGHTKFLAYIRGARYSDKREFSLILKSNGVLHKFQPLSMFYSVEETTYIKRISHLCL